MAIHAAVGAECSDLRIPIPNYFVPSSFGSLELIGSATNEFIGQPIDYSSDKMEVIKMVSVDSLNLQRLDLLKIDVEGMELEVLHGARQSLQSSRPILVVEAIKTDKVELAKLLQDADYQMFTLGQNIAAIHTSDPCLSDVCERLQRDRAVK